MGKVVFLGVEGAGKSVLTAALAGYLDKRKDHCWSLRPENKEAFTFSTRMPKLLDGGELPAQTATFRHLRWSICYQDLPQRTLEVLDYPGEIYRLAFLDPADDSNPDDLRAKQKAHAADIRELMGFLKEADQVFVLFNINDAKNLETDNTNIDAVWVTMSAIRILSSLENMPDLTLLITQADRLEKEGEPVGNADKIVAKYLPLIAQRFKELDKRMISALDYNNALYGLLPLVASLLEKTELYQKQVSQWELFRKILRLGRMDEKEYSGLLAWAKTFEWFSEEAASFLKLREEVEELLDVKKHCQEIDEQERGHKAKIAALQALQQEARFDSSREHLDGVIRGKKADHTGNQIGAFVLITVLGILVIMGLCGIFIGK